MQKMVFLWLLLAGFAIGALAQEPLPARPAAYITVKGDTLKNIGDDIVFTKCEVESDFPGGSKRWRQYVQSHLAYPRKAIRDSIQGTVVLQFVVCIDGAVCNMEAISGPPLLQQAALDALKETPRWTPATIGGKLVKSYKRQPIIFRIPSK